MECYCFLRCWESTLLAPWAFHVYPCPIPFQFPPNLSSFPESRRTQILHQPWISHQVVPSNFLSKFLACFFHLCVSAIRTLKVNDTSLISILTITIQAAPNLLTWSPTDCGIRKLLQVQQSSLLMLSDHRTHYSLPLLLNFPICQNPWDFSVTINLRISHYNLQSTDVNITSQADRIYEAV